MSTVESIAQLQQPLTEGGIRNVNFFNGRLLTGKDLSREQAARREADGRLGLALGDGVAFGLDAARDPLHDRADAPVLRVKAGLAVNRAGQTLRLQNDASVALTRRFDAAGGAACDCMPFSGMFADCSPVAGGTYVAGAGVYLLTIAPARTNEGRAPTNGLDPTNVRCNTDATVDGVQFRLLAINPLRFADLDPASSRFRNRLAYRCFGIDAREAAAIDPWREDPQSYGLVDELREVGLGDCDVPLALVYWTAGGLQFVDPWAVRRRLLGPDALRDHAFVARARRLVEAEAMCAQFQQHLADLLAASAAPTTLRAVDHFRHLPPFGLVPLQTLPLRGVVDATFFEGIPRRPHAGSGQSTPFIDARLLGAMREQARTYTPTDLRTGEFLWVHRVWQPLQAALEGEATQPVLAFACGLMPEMAIARFDMARFDNSNYANCCSAL